MNDKNSNSNRLIGWLVSYASDPKGHYHEIRAGRSIVSSERLGNSKIITVSEESISSPHMALQASPQHRVMVQDIFSDHGSFITKSKDTREAKISGPTEIEHGDWIRVGERERFQVCLIDGPSR